MSAPRSMQPPVPCIFLVLMNSLAARHGYRRRQGRSTVVCPVATGPALGRACLAAGQRWSSSAQSGTTTGPLQRPHRFDAADCHRRPGRPGSTVSAYFQMPLRWDRAGAGIPADEPARLDWMSGSLGTGGRAVCLFSAGHSRVVQRLVVFALPKPASAYVPRIPRLPPRLPFHVPSPDRVHPQSFITGRPGIGGPPPAAAPYRPFGNSG